MKRLVPLPLLLFACNAQTPVASATLDDLAIEVDALVEAAGESWTFETLPYSGDLCDPIPGDPGPYGSDTLLHTADIIAVNTDAYTEVVPRHRYTADGRRGFESSAPLGKPETRVTQFLPLDWRRDWSVTTDHSSETTTTWSWEGEAGTAVTSSTSGDGSERTITYREDGLPLVSGTDTWTYVNDQSWQLAERVEGDRVETYTWFCLTATIRRSDSDRVRIVSYMPDGRVRYTIDDRDGDGNADFAWGITYLEDSWRIDEEGGLLEPGSAGRVWEWGP